MWSRKGSVRATEAFLYISLPGMMDAIPSIGRHGSEQHSSPLGSPRAFPRLTRPAAQWSRSMRIPLEGASLEKPTRISFAFRMAGETEKGSRDMDIRVCESCGRSVYLKSRRSMAAPVIRGGPTSSRHSGRSSTWTQPELRCTPAIRASPETRTIISITG